MTHVHVEMPVRQEVAGANADSRGTLVSLLLLLGLAAYWVSYLAGEWTRRLEFDDAYMFYRYALQFRRGFGVSWNEAAGHTYGPTSLLWSFIIDGLSLFPLTQSQVLMSASWLAAVGAVAAMAWAVSCSAATPLFRRAWRGAAAIGLVAVVSGAFRYAALTGMDTMLSMAMSALGCGAVLLWARVPERRHAVLVGVLLFGAFLARPDSALPLLVLIGLFDRLVLDRSARGRSLWVILGVFFALVAGELLICQLYFKTMLPLSFYVKSHHAYDGYTDDWAPMLSLLLILGEFALLPMLLLLLPAGRRLTRVSLAFGGAALAGAAYYTFFVLQIMGVQGRYYLPLLPFLLIPAALVFDEVLLRKSARASSRLLARGAAALFLLAAIDLREVLSEHFEELHGTHIAWRSPQRTTRAGRELPKTPYFNTQTWLADEVLHDLPRGASIAATEVGYLGASNPQVTVIDLSGLNDTRIALDGFSAQAVLARKPDLIWMPFPTYTRMYGELYAAPALLQQYTVYDGAANYGLAVRKDSPYRQQIESGLARMWSHAYPGLPMQDYVVQEVRWDDQGYPVHWNGTTYQGL